MRWTQIRRFFVGVGLITVLYGLVIIGRMTAGASVSLWGANPTAIIPASVSPLPAVPPAPAPPAVALAPLPAVTAQVIPAPPPAPAPTSEDEALEQAYKRRLLEEGDP